MTGAGKGKFITFEGGEGTGKSTQVARLESRLSAHGIDALVTREPGGTAFAERVRDLLLEDQAPSRSPVAETLLFYAAREDHLAQVIRPALGNGQWVLCDRFSDSTRVYQGAGGLVDMAIIDMLDKAIVADHQPDLTFVLDLPADIGLARARERARLEGRVSSDPFEGRDLDYHEVLRQGFLEIAANEPGRCIIVSALASTEEISDLIWSQIQQRLL